MSRLMARSVAVAFVLVTLAACSATPAPPGGAVRVVDRDGDFMLAISTPHLVWEAQRPITVGAQLSYLGPGSIALAGPGPGPHVAFGVVELTGHREMGPAWLQACKHWKMSSVPIAVPFNKSGGWSSDDPDAPFYAAYLNDREFRLPAGRWEVSAYAPFSVGDCDSGEDINLQATLTLTVQ